MNMTKPSLEGTAEKIDKDTMVAMVAHDLKNPVSSSIMALKLLENKQLSPLNAYQEEILQNLSFGMRYMKNLIENVLDRYKFNNNKYVINKCPTDVVCLIKSIITETEYLFADKKQSIKFNNNIKNSFINIDPLEFERIINNLFVNASKYSPVKSLIILNVSERLNTLVFSVENPGRGIDLKNPNDVLQKFVSCNCESKTIACGLGLYIVKEIVNAHGGEIFVESEIDKFTRITFTLPRK